MKVTIRRILSVLLMIVLLAGIIPTGALAADNEWVLKSIGNTSAVTKDGLNNTTDRSVTLEVRNSFSGPLNVETGLTYEKDSSIGDVSFVFSSSTASVGQTVQLTVSYYKGTDTTTLHTTTYNITIAQADKVNAAYGGSITKSKASLPNGTVEDITFTENDFTSTSLYTANDGGDISGISISGSGLGTGSLKIRNGGSYIPYSGSIISRSNINNLVFDGTGNGTVVYLVTAYDASGTPTIGTVSLKLTFNAITVPDAETNISISNVNSSSYTFTLSDFINHCKLNNGTLQSVVITPTNTGYGTWSGPSGTFTAATMITADQLNSGRLKFTGNSTSGTATFTWTVSNEAGVSQPKNGTITVNAASVPTISASVSKQVNVGATVTFALSDFQSCYNLNNGTLTQIVVNPTNSSYGRWYRGNDQFTSATAFTASTISTLRFVGTAAGQATFTWTVSNEKGTSPWGNGTVKVGSSFADVNYTIAQNTPKTFVASDFYTACSNAMSGASLYYIYFSSPYVSNGTLYSGYSSASSPGSVISANTAYYYSSSPSLANITFVPASNFSGTITIQYTGGTTSGTSFTGYIKITVGSSSSDVNYTTAKNTPKTFNATDFNNVCISATGANLSGVYFTLPSSSYGTLYYNYSSASYPGTVISSGNLIQTSYLSYITFVPASNYTGTVTIPYTGYGTNNIQYTGYIKITIGSSSSDVNYTTAMNTPKTFNATDFNNVCISATGANLNYVYFTTPSSSYGTLYYNYSSASYPGTQINSSNQIQTSYLSSITFVPTSNYTGTVTIPYTGYGTNGVQYTGYIKITIGSSSSDVNYTTAMNTPKTFNATDFNNVCISATGANLSGVYFTLPSSSYGTLYYNYSSASYPGTAISSGNLIQTSYLSYITFVPASNYTGTVTIPYTGYGTNNIQYTGYVKITVGSSSTDITYTTAKNTPKTFIATDFNTICISATGANLNGVYFTLPSSSYGTLYYNYSSASSPGTAIISSNLIQTSYLSYITFVPASNFTGTVTIPYTGVSTSGSSYTGNIKITVGSSYADVTYTTAKNTPKTFVTADFNNACISTTGANLSGIYFTTPSSSYGTLYYNYSSASSPGTAIISSNLIQTSYLSSITFVPASNYTGTVTIPYTGVSTNNVTYTGSVKITVGSAGTVTYTTTKNTAKTFAADDFNTACYSTTGVNLSSVYFTLPSSSYGTLYYNYSSTSTNTPVSANTPYYVSSSLYLSYVTFVPASNYTGTVTITYTGYNTSGTTYTGSVVITVAGSVSDVTYTTAAGTAVAFSSTDFNSACYSATGANLSYIAFTLPSTTYGTLYYNYVSPSNKGTAVPAGAKLYTGESPYISYVKFVPTANYTGNVTIAYTGSNVNGVSFSGKLIIKVTQQTGSSYFSDVGQSYDWAADAIDYLHEKDVVNGISGTLYGPASSIKRGDFILMLYRALDFTGSTSSNFSDVPKSMYYYNAIAAAKSLGIALGENNKFKPEAPLTRQDAMVLIYRALLVTGPKLSTGSASNTSGFTDKGKISSYALTAVQTLVKANIVTGSNSKINPLGNLTRAEMAVILYRVMQI